MAFNQIQFQHGMSIPEFLRSFGTEAQCAEAIKAARWPEGFRCPRCARLPLLESGADYCVDRHGNPRELVSVVANLLRRLRRFINLPSGFAEEGASCLATDQRRMVLEQSGMPRNRADHQGEANLDVPV